MSDTRTTRIIPTNLFSGFIFPHFPEIPFLAIFHFWRFSNFCPEGTFGVGEVAKRGYGQFSENPRTIPLARSFPPAPSLLGSESSANRLLIAGKLARKIRWDNISLEGARFSDLGQLFACALRRSREVTHVCHPEVNHLVIR